MTRVTTVLAIARADFLERIRRQSFLLTLGFALYLGYLATVGKLMLRVGHMRGIFNSAWVGGLLSLVASAFISLVGFYFVKNTIQRDRDTRVGQILAATPISKFIYVHGKTASNLAVLGLMVVIVAVSGIAMQLVRGEDRHIEVWKLFAPFLLLAFPAMAVVAAIAVLFETIPFLRGGFGNIAYFFAWADLSPGKPRRETQEAATALVPRRVNASIPFSSVSLTPLGTEQAHSRFLGILTAELRLILKVQKWWWYVVATGLAIASAVVPTAEARGLVLACAWIWPVLLWSSMGMRETREQTYQLIFSAPRPIARQLPAVWMAGVLVALLTGGGFGIRLLLGGNIRGLMAWFIGVFFIPTFALSLSVWSGTGKPFEICYTLLWYVGPLHAVPQLDFMGSAPATAASRYPLFYLVLTCILGVVALTGRKHQLKS